MSDESDCQHLVWWGRSLAEGQSCCLPEVPNLDTLLTPSINITNRTRDKGKPWQSRNPLKTCLAWRQKGKQDQTSELPWSSQQPCKSKERFHYSTARMESKLLLLNPNNRMGPPFQHPGINFSREADQWNTPIIRAHSLVLLFQNENQHPGLSLPSFCPKPPCNIYEAFNQWRCGMM